MNVVRHQTPSPKMISHSVKMSERALAHLRDLGAAQPTLAAAFVEIGFQFFAPLAILLDFQKVGPFAQKFAWERISQVVGDELRKPGRIAMGKIPALVPAAEPLAMAGKTRAGVPAAFSFDQITHARIVGRTRQRASR